MCIETEEGPHHILYSLFWSNDLDVVVVSIAGTTKELWDTLSSFRHSSLGPHRGIPNRNR